MNHRIIVDLRIVLRSNHVASSFYHLSHRIHVSGQIIMFHQPRFPWNKGMSLTKVVWGRYNLTKCSCIWLSFSMVNVKVNKHTWRHGRVYSGQMTRMLKPGYISFSLVLRWFLSFFLPQQFEVEVGDRSRRHLTFHAWGCWRERGWRADTFGYETPLNIYPPVI